MDKHSSSDDDPLSRLLADRIRRERDTRGWSIAELAAVSGVSRAMISKIERAEASPTATLLGKLSGALGLTVSALLARAEADAAPGRIVRAVDQVPWIDPETGYIRRALSPPGIDPEMVQVDLPPGKSVSYPGESYAFIRGHCVWMLSGQLVIHEGDDEMHLEKGDCFSFDMTTTKPRSYANPSCTTPATYIVSLVRH